MAFEKPLNGFRVLDLAAEAGAMIGRLLSDLGAEVVHMEPPSGDPLRNAPPFLGDRRDPDASLRFAAWSAGKQSVVLEAGDPAFEDWLRGADVIVHTPGWPGIPNVEASSAPQAVWLLVTPFGATGPRSGWKASDLGVMAASGNMFSTGYPDRAPLRCSEPSSYAHVGPEGVFAILSALATGRPQVVDLSMQEVVTVSNMSGVAQAFRGGVKGRRLGAQMGRTREIWHTGDGFVSFGLRGGRARVPSLRTLAALLEEEGLANDAWRDRDWDAFDQFKASDEELAALEAPLKEFFASKTMMELYEKACETGLMLAPVNSPREILASAQAISRRMYRRLGILEGFPVRFAALSSLGDSGAEIAAPAPAPALGARASSAWSPRAVSAPVPAPPGRGAWAGVKIVEFGAGAAGPIAARFFAEHGATVIKVESRTRPEFLRTMWACLLYTSPSPRDVEESRMPSSA